MTQTKKEKRYTVLHIFHFLLVLSVVSRQSDIGQSVSSVLRCFSQCVSFLSVREHPFLCPQ